MKRKDFLKGAGLAGISTLFPLDKLFSKSNEMGDPSKVCTLIPSVTAGPFPLDLTTNPFYFRKDLKEDRVGVQFNLKLKIIGADNCLPMSNLRVNIWHCSNEGLYSGYDNNMNKGQAGKTYCRGYQFTDSNGIAEFDTIFPGWYSGRITHIHFQVYVSSVYAAVSQLSFDPNAKNALYLANQSLYSQGADPTTFSKDNVFSDGYSLQIANLTENKKTGGYDGYLEVTIKGSGLLGVGHIEKENTKNFTLGQNFPNPYLDKTTIPFLLKYESDVEFTFFDLQGKKVHHIELPSHIAGEHKVEFNSSKFNLPHSNYVYQIQVKNIMGIYSDIKMMTAL
ncbi:MAG: hypothetical protein ABIO44_03645 [Saprospiraceae bacterium]